ncbi:MAG: hypothetical protein KAT05_03735 [Spirochaetes bacterium]|nr:hypothetical protein [Spirochaetota bacterium]
MPKIKIDIEKITGPYQLLALLLIVFGFWLYKADTAIERIIAGILIILILAYFFMKKEESKPIIPPGFKDEFTPAEKEATEEEIKYPEPQRIAAPDGSYSINIPPQNWTIQEMTSTEWMIDGWQITDPSIKEKMLGTSSEVRNILSFKSDKTTSIIPIPGQTVIDGRKFPSALALLIPTRLAIIPIDRYQPPLFIERPIEHNFSKYINEIMQIGVFTLHNLSSGKITNSDLKYMEADFRQEIEGAMVNGKEIKNVNSNIIIIGIEGELRDYLLFLNYPSIPEANDPELERDLQILRSLVSSFRPLKIINPDEKREELQKKADENFKELMAEKGEDLFYAEFEILLLRLSGLDIDDPEQRLNAIKMIKPFETFSKEINLQDEDLNKLWNSLPEVEKGNAINFKSQLKEMFELMKEEEEELNVNLTANDDNENFDDGQ